MGNEKLRDKFAAAALTGLLVGGDMNADSTATWAYTYADAMLRARQLPEQVATDDADEGLDLAKAYTADVPKK